jgi:predicted RNA-binding protein with PIN domain
MVPPRAPSFPRSSVADVLYLFDGYNLLHAGGYRSLEELVDRLASFVAFQGARGVVVFDGAGTDAVVGSLEVRFAPAADHLLERLAAEHRDQIDVTLVSTDRAIRETAGMMVRKLRSRDFSRQLEDAQKEGFTASTGKVEDALEDDVRRRLDEWRRGSA